MRAPRARNVKVDAARLRSWHNQFASYRSQITQSTVEDWLRQFKRTHRDLGARILDSVDFYDQARITRLYQKALSSIPGWSSDKNQRIGRWFFVPLTRGAGESGDAMMHPFRIANRLDGRGNDYLFKGPAQITSQQLNSEDTVVIVDDFSGTGAQVCGWWNGTADNDGDSVVASELFAGAGRVYLVLTCATEKLSQGFDRRRVYLQWLGIYLVGRTTFSLVSARTLMRRRKQLHWNIAGSHLELAPKVMAIVD